MTAVENILGMKDYAQQYKIIKIIFENLFKVTSCMSAIYMYI